MSVRRASSALCRVPARAPLVERDAAAPEQVPATAGWDGEVRLVADRATGTSAPRWQHHVRTGLLERALALGAAHRAGPHRARPEVGSRLLAHIDALAEAGLSLDALRAFSEEAELDRPGALWVLALLHGCLDVPRADEAFERWAGALDPSLFLDYRGVVEVAEALAIEPGGVLRGALLRWAAGPSPVLAAIALEVLPVRALPDEALAQLAGAESPLVAAAVERFLLRAAQEEPRTAPRRWAWIDLPVPALAYQAARARLLAGDLEPLHSLRERGRHAVDALGACALDLLALGGEASDADLARTLVQGLPTTSGLLDAMGRVGLPVLFPRLVAELASDDFEDDAHAALATALGPRVARPDAKAWEQAIAALHEGGGPVRLRGGEPRSLRSIAQEMQRPELSAEDLRARADEVWAMGRAPIRVAWEAFGVSLEGAVSEVARLAR